MRRLGVHTSIAGGIYLSLERARELGCTTLQLFSHNPRIWMVHRIPEEALLRFRQLKNSYDMTPIFIHSSYLINLASSSREVRDKSMPLLIQELDHADSLDAEYVVLHTGSASQDTGDAGRKKAVEALKRISEQGRWRAKILLENTAGERGDISSRIQDLAGIIEGTGSALIGGVCIDTCHAFQAGYDIAKKTGLLEIAQEIENHIGFKRVKLIHLNDSKRGFHSRVDRHDHIGSGSIGKDGLGRFINHPGFRDVPIILETPKKSEDDDPRNLKIVRRLFRP